MDLRDGLVIVLLLGSYLFVEVHGYLQVGYYNNKCPKAESIVRDVIKSALKEDVGISADILRMQFHDCFVRGCDASILLDSTKKHKAEKDSPINNPSLEEEAFELIDKAKSKLEAACKGVVSCADIISFAARDGVSLVGGPYYEVPAGRRDGSVSRLSDTLTNLPPPNFNLNQLTSLFASKGLTQKEMIALSGAHTIGISHCNSFDNRLYSFSSKQKQDPSLNPIYAKKLKRVCPGGAIDANITTPLDPTTPNKFDSNYYNNILNHKVLFTSDQTLVSTNKALAQVKLYAHDQAGFMKDFADAMVKMGTIGVLTGKQGEVRLNCRVVN